MLISTKIVNHTFEINCITSLGKNTKMSIELFYYYKHFMTICSRKKTVKMITNRCCSRQCWGVTDKAHSTFSPNANFITLVTQVSCCKKRDVKLLIT